MPEIRPGLGDPHTVLEVRPILSHNVGSPSRQSTEVVHHGKGSPVQVGSFATTRENLGEMVTVGFGNQLTSEPLNEDPVDAVLFHPLKVAEYGGGVVVAWKFGRFAVGEFKRGWISLLRRQFANVGPEIEAAASRLEAVTSCVVHPAELGAVPFGAMPALISAHHFAEKGRCVDAANLGARVWREPLGAGEELAPASKAQGQAMPKEAPWKQSTPYQTKRRQEQFRGS